MNFDTLAGTYVYCMNYHFGQESRLYRILSRISKKGMRLSDSAIKAIQDARYDPRNEWDGEREVYMTLIMKETK